MKNKNYIHPVTLFILLTLCVVFCSWIVSGYGWRGVQNLLSVDGLRWMLRYSEDNFINSPALVVTCMLFFGLGLVQHSGLGDALHRLVSNDRILSRKQKRALALSAISVFLYGFVCCILVWGPWGIVRSITGVFKGSPLEDGILLVISLGIGISGIIYGFAVDNYRRDKDIYHGMSAFYSRFAEYFVCLFFIEQFFSVLNYSGLLTVSDVPEEIVGILYVISCIFSFFSCKMCAFSH